MISLGIPLAIPALLTIPYNVIPDDLIVLAASLILLSLVTSNSSNDSRSLYVVSLSSIVLTALSPFSSDRLHRYTCVSV